MTIKSKGKNTIVYEELLKMQFQLSQVCGLDESRRPQGRDLPAWPSTHHMGFWVKLSTSSGKETG